MKYFFPILTFSLLFFSASTAKSATLIWQGEGIDKIEGEYKGLSESNVIIITSSGKEAYLPFHKLSPESQQQVSQIESSMLTPLHSWLNGYKVRFAVQIIDKNITGKKTVIVSIPSGGWLKPDASDLVVLNRMGKRMPNVVISSGTYGDTLCQFKINGLERWYWVYIANPQAPDKNLEQEEAIKKAKADSEQATLKKMAAMKKSAEKAAEFRDISALVEKEKNLISGADKEIAELEKIIPEHEKNAAEKNAVLPQLKAELDKAATTYAPLKQEADNKTADARAKEREAGALRAKANNSLTEYQNAVKAFEIAEENSKNARVNLERARQNGENADNIAQKQNVLNAALRDVEDKKNKVEQLNKEKTDLDAKAAAAEKTAAEANEKAQAARLAAAPAATAHANAEAAYNQATAEAKNAAQVLETTKKRLEETRKMRTEAEKRLGELIPKFEPIKKAYEDAAAEAEKAAIEAAELEKLYFQTAFEADPRLFKEGLTVEFREWAGDKLNSWPEVVDGLKKSENVLGASVTGEVLQNTNPFRRYDPRNFAASYRGYLKIDNPGIYSFFVNGDDAAFLFINGYLVYSRTGSNKPIRGKVPIYSVGADIQLEEGIHPFELHHIVGNTADASGLCTLSWLTPGSKQWQFVPREAFNQALTAIPVSIESFDGKPVAVFHYGVSDRLSSDGINLYLCRFEAQCSSPNFNKLKWNFGDRTDAIGSSVYHVYFDADTYEVTLSSHNSLPPFKRHCQVWTPPIPTSPASLETAILSFEKNDIAKFDYARLNDLFHFLIICNHPMRWQLMETVCHQLLKNQKLDLKYRTDIYVALMYSLAEQGKASEALNIIDTARKEIGNYRTLHVLINLHAANIMRDYLRDYKSADQMYATILENNQRLRHPIIRQTAIEWGDMLLDAGDIAKAASSYRAAMSLGSIGAAGETKSDAVERGALLRMAEQQLRTGNIRQSKRLLERIETLFPEQKVEGLYRFLRGEVERTGGSYEKAIRNYEMLLQLPQWAGYHAMAKYGIADCYYRMAQYTNASEWLEELAKQEPVIYQEKGAALKKQIETRFNPSQGIKNTNPFFSFYENKFEEKDILPVQANNVCLRNNMGFSGPHSVWLDSSEGNTISFSVPLGIISNIPPQGTFWIELWYRDFLSIPGGNNWRHIRADVVNEKGEAVFPATALLERTFGQWHKAALHVAIPNTINGRASVAVYNTGGYLEVDAVSIRHISDSLLENLTRFIEGADPQ